MFNFQEEYERFCKMDEERYERERKIYKNFPESLDNAGEGGKKFFNYRLMAYEEIPTWFLSAVTFYFISA